MSEAHRRAGRLGALTTHALGKTTTRKARAAFEAKFEKEVDPDGVLSPEERWKRAQHAMRAHYIRMRQKRGLGKG